MRDVKAFWKFSETYGYVNKEVVIAYKEKLTSDYMFSSVNSMLAAVNCFLKEMGWNECIVKALKVQKEAFRSPEKDLSKEEYHRLLYAAQKKGNERLYLLMQTLCSTGILHRRNCDALRLKRFIQEEPGCVQRERAGQY